MVCLTNTQLLVMAWRRHKPERYKDWIELICPKYATLNPWKYNYYSEIRARSQVTARFMLRWIGSD